MTESLSIIFVCFVEFCTMPEWQKQRNIHEVFLFYHISLEKKSIF